MSATTKHTPGPWRVAIDGYRAIYVAQENGGYVPLATPFRHDAFTPGPTRCDVSDATLEANAKLIAAAPELLEALKLCVAQGGRNDSYALNMARAAIAKAEGAE